SSRNDHETCRGFYEQPHRHGRIDRSLHELPLLGHCQRVVTVARPAPLALWLTRFLTASSTLNVGCAICVSACPTARSQSGESNCVPCGQLRQRPARNS